MPTRPPAVLSRAVAGFELPARGDVGVVTRPPPEEIEMAILPSTIPTPPRSPTPTAAPPRTTIDDLPPEVMIDVMKFLAHPGRRRASVRRDLEALGMVTRRGTGGMGALRALAVKALVTQRSRSIGASVTHPPLAAQLQRQMGLMLANVDTADGALAGRLVDDAIRFGIAFSRPRRGAVSAESLRPLTARERNRVWTSMCQASALGVFGVLGVVTPAITLTADKGNAKFSTSGRWVVGVVAGVAGVCALASAMLQAREARRLTASLRTAEALAVDFNSAADRGQFADGWDFRRALDEVKLEGLAVLCPARTATAAPTIGNLCAASLVNLPLRVRAERFRSVMWPEFDRTTAPADTLALMNAMLLDRAAPLAFVGLDQRTAGDGATTALDRLEAMTDRLDAETRPEFARALQALAPHLERAAPDARFDALERLLRGPTAERSEGLMNHLDRPGDLLAALTTIQCVRTGDLDARSPGRQAKVVAMVEQLRSRRGLHRVMIPMSLAALAERVFDPTAPAGHVPDLAGLDRLLRLVDVLRLVYPDDGAAIDMLRHPVVYDAIPPDERLGALVRVLQSLAPLRTSRCDTVVSTLIDGLLPHLPRHDLLEALHLLRAVIGSECFNPGAVVETLDASLVRMGIHDTPMRRQVLAELVEIVDDVATSLRFGFDDGHTWMRPPYVNSVWYWSRA